MPVKSLLPSILVNQNGQYRPKISLIINDIQYKLDKYPLAGIFPMVKVPENFTHRYSQAVNYKKYKYKEIQYEQKHHLGE